MATIREKSKEGIGRVFHATLASQQVIMLHAFLKKFAKPNLQIVSEKV